MTGCFRLYIYDGENVIRDAFFRCACTSPASQPASHCSTAQTPRPITEHTIQTGWLWGKKGPATKRVVGSEAAAAVAHRSEEVDQPGLLPVRREVVGSQSRHVSADAVPRKAHNVVEHIFTCRTGATDRLLICN